MASDFSHSFSYQKFLTGPRPPRSDSVEPHHIGRNSIILYEVDPDHYCRFENGAQNSPPLYTPPESLRRSALRESREEFRRIKPELYKLCLECRRLHLDADDNRRGSDNSSQNTSEEDLHTDSDSSNAPEISGSNREENREGNREEKGGEKGEETHSHTSGFSSSSSFSQSSGSSSFSQSSSSSCSCQSATRRSTVRSLLQSSNAGCHLCTLIAGALASTYGRRWLEDMSESSFFVFIDASTSTLKIVCENNVVSLSIADVPPDFSRVKHHSELFYPATMTLQQISAPLPDNCYTVMDSHTAARTLVSPGGNMYNEVKPKCGSKVRTL